MEKNNSKVKYLLQLFFRGLLLVGPAFASGYVVYWAITSIDGLINVGIPGVGIIAVLIGITLIGYLMNTFITDPIISYFDRLLNKIPLIKLIFGSIKDLMEAFVGEDKKFKEPVIVEMEPGAFKIGFMTQKEFKSKDLNGLVAVYFPFSYAFTGNLYLIEKEKVRPIDINSAEAMKFIISGGVSGDDI